MTATSTDTTTAARIARVTVDTIRTWCRIGAVAAAKVSGRWVIDTDSLNRRVTLGRVVTAERNANVVDLSAFRDARAARSKALELISEGGIIPGSRPGLWLAVSSDGGNTYAIDTWEPSCTCKGHVYTGRCFHMVAATLLDRSAQVRSAA
jgi:hypothetical protein